MKGPSGSALEQEPGGEEPKFEGPMTQEEYFRQLEKEAAERVKKKLEEQRREDERSSEPKEELPIPDGNGRTWGEFTEEVENYLKRYVNGNEVMNPRSSDPRPQDIPYIRQLAQFLVGRKRFGSEDLKNEPVDPEELNRETNQLLNDRGFGQLLKSQHFRFLLAWRGADSAWEHILEASTKAYQELGQTSPYIYSVQENRANRERAAVERQQPMKTAIDSVYARLTDERYNTDIRKTGFLFFKPSDTGLFQTAVRALGVIAAAKSGAVRAGDLTTAKQAVKEYLDARKAVRAHEYGNRRWEKMMCAYKALETPENFARYCKELNDYRGLKDPQDVQDARYVHPSAFDAARMDLANPRIPMNEALRQLKQEYAKEAAADKDAATLRYFARVSAMRSQAAEKNANGDWGALVDMEKIRTQGEDLSRDPDFLEAYRGGDRRVMFAKADQILHPHQRELDDDSTKLKPEAPEQEKEQKSIGDAGGKVRI